MPPARDQSRPYEYRERFRLVILFTNRASHVELHRPRWHGTAGVWTRMGMAEIDELVTARSRALAQELAGVSGDIYIREAIIKLALDALSHSFLPATKLRPFELADHLRILAHALQAPVPDR